MRPSVFVRVRDAAPFGVCSGAWRCALRYLFGLCRYVYMSISIYPFSVIIRVRDADRSADHITILTYSNVIKRPPPSVAQRNAVRATPRRMIHFPGRPDRIVACVVSYVQGALLTYMALRRYEGKKVWCACGKNMGRSGTLRGQERSYIKNLDRGMRGLA